MNINIEIRHVGQAMGTIGWLAENAAAISIGPTKETHKQGAWLKDKEGKTITVLAIRDWLGDGEIMRAVNSGGWDLPGEFQSPVHFTEAAWAIVMQLQDIAVKAMDETESRELAEAYVLAVTK